MNEREIGKGGGEEKGLLPCLSLVGFRPFKGMMSVENEQEMKKK